MKRWLVVLLLTLAGALSWSTGAAAQGHGESCPPQATLPTQPQLQAAQARARDRGFLWRISRDGRTHHLYGTIHVGRLDWAVPGPKVRAALVDAQVLALEIDPLDPAVQAGLRRPAGAVPALPQALSQRLARQLERACLPLQALAGMHPIMQATTALIVDAARDGLHAAYGQELALAAAAKARSARTVSLETPERQLAALIPADAALAERQLTATLDQLDSGTARRVLLRLADAWERGDLATVEGYERWCDCVNTAEERALMAALNDQRNPAMAERIEALHRDGQRLFVAVGALHMTGPQALPALLAARGFRVERVEFR
jgi:hypothetical protein